MTGGTLRAAAPPPAISGGTLLSTRDGALLVAADPDRDQLYFVDVQSEKLLHVRALHAGDEPGRVVEDAKARIHVVLRGGRSVATLTREPNSAITRREVCAVPRGIAYDVAHDQLHVACAEVANSCSNRKPWAAAEVLVPVVSQPSLPLAIGKARAASIDCASAELDLVAERCQREGLRVLGLRFRDDPFVPEARFAFLKQRLGAGFVAVELSPRDGHPNNPFPHMHSVLTEALVDEPEAPTRAALEQVLDLLHDKLLTGARSQRAQGGPMQHE